MTQKIRMVFILVEEIDRYDYLDPKSRWLFFYSSVLQFSAPSGKGKETFASSLKKCVERRRGPRGGRERARVRRRALIRLLEERRERERGRKVDKN